MSDFINTKLPVEILHEIFLLTTSVSGKDEFSEDPRVYEQIPCEGSSFDSQLTWSEISGVILERRKLLLVCKRWQAVATPIFWSHLVIRAWMGIQEIDSIAIYLTRNPTVIPYIVRLTVEPTKHSLKDQDPSRLRDHHIRELISIIPSIRILSSSHQGIPDTDTTSIVLAIVRSGMYREGTSRVWTDLRTLILNLLGLKYPSEEIPPLKFPVLETCHITSPGIFLRSIGDKWETPSLQVLSVTGEPAAALALAQKWSSKLVKLQVTGTIRSSEPIHLPLLTTLYIGSVSPLSWAERGTLTLPSLRRFGLFETGYAPEHSIPSLVDIFLQKYPTIREICILPSKARCFESRNWDLWHKAAVEKWANNAIAVYLHPVQEWGEDLA